MAQDGARAVVNDRYRIEQVISEGPFSRVYRATDTRLHLPVALVELLVHRVVRDAAAWEARRAALLHEATVIAGVRHRHIVAVYDHFTDEPGNLFLVREYVAGGNLRQLLARVPRQRMGRAVTVAQDLLAGLAALHRRGITHGALSPERVLLAPPPRPGEPERAKLTDFGDARTGEAGDAHADLYAVGAIFYEMLVGERHGDDRHPITDGDPAMPPALAALLARALDTDPAARFTRAEAMEQALTRLDLGDAAGQTLETWARTTHTATVVSPRPPEHTPVAEPVPAVLPAVADRRTPDVIPAPAPAAQNAETPPVVLTARPPQQEAASSPTDDLTHMAALPRAPVLLPTPPTQESPHDAVSRREVEDSTPPMQEPAPAPAPALPAAPPAEAIAAGPLPTQTPVRPHAPLAAVPLPEERRERLAAAWGAAKPPPVEPSPPELPIASAPAPSPIVARFPAAAEQPPAPPPSVEFTSVEPAPVPLPPPEPAPLLLAPPSLPSSPPPLPVTPPPPAPVGKPPGVSTVAPPPPVVPAALLVPPVLPGPPSEPEPEPPPPAVRTLAEGEPYVRRSRSGQRWLRWAVPVMLAVVLVLVAAVGPTLLRRSREGSVTATPRVVSVQRAEPVVGTVTATTFAVAPLPTGVRTATPPVTPTMMTAPPVAPVAPTPLPGAMTAMPPLVTVVALPPTPSLAPRPAPEVTPPAVPVMPVLTPAPSDYTGGIAALDGGDYALAVMLLSRAQGGGDAMLALAYAQGMVAVGMEAYDEAARTFTAAGGFRDAPQRVQDSRVRAGEQGAYRAGERAAADGDLIEAIRQFAAAGDYRDAGTRLAQVQDEQTLRLRYGDAQALLQERKYAEAHAILEEIERFRPGYRDVPRILANLTGDVLPVTLDLRVLEMTKDAAHLTPVYNLIGKPVAYLRLSPSVEYRGGASAFVGGVRVEVIAGSELNAPRMNTANPVFIAADEPALRANIRGGEQVVVAAQGETRQVPGFGDYTATFAVRDATTRPEGAALPDGTRTRASTFRTLVLEVALRR